MLELYNALKFITILFLIQKILTFNLGVAFLKSVSILHPYGQQSLLETGNTPLCSNRTYECLRPHERRK